MKEKLMNAWGWVKEHGVDIAMCGSVAVVTGCCVAVTAKFLRDPAPVVNQFILDIPDTLIESEKENIT